MFWRISAAIVFAAIASPASPHSGKTDPYGCHEQTAVDIRHCHDADNNMLPWPPVKKSRSSICHDRDSQWYDQTIHFKPFKTMKECLDSGGRRPVS